MPTSELIPITRDELAFLKRLEKQALSGKSIRVGADEFTIAEVRNVTKEVWQILLDIEHNRADELRNLFRKKRYFTYPIFDLMYQDGPKKGQKTTRHFLFNAEGEFPEIID